MLICTVNLYNRLMCHKWLCLMMVLRVDFHAFSKHYIMHIYTKSPPCKQVMFASEIGLVHTHLNIATVGKCLCVLDE